MTLRNITLASSQVEGSKSKFKGKSEPQRFWNPQWWCWDICYLWQGTRSKMSPGNGRYLIRSITFQPSIWRMTHWIFLGQYTHPHLEAQPNETAAETTNGSGDIEGDIEKELVSIKSSSTNLKKPYTFVRLEIACGMSSTVPFHSTQILLCAMHWSVFYPSVIHSHTSPRGPGQSSSSDLRRSVLRNEPAAKPLRQTLDAGQLHSKDARERLGAIVWGSAEARLWRRYRYEEGTKPGHQQKLHCIADI